MKGHWDAQYLKNKHLYIFILHNTTILKANFAKDNF